MNTITINSLSDLPKVADLVLESLNGRNVVAFFAPMGAGKTTLISTLMETLGSEDIVTSPTFALVNQYYTAEREPVYHFDFYRIKKLDEVYDMGYEDYFYSGALCFIEWPELVEEVLPGDAVKVIIEEVEDGTRSVRLESMD